MELVLIGVSALLVSGLTLFSGFGLVAGRSPLQWACRYRRLGGGKSHPSV